jgi:signal transduction histidine kinase
LFVSAAVATAMACLPLAAGVIPGRLPGDGWPIAAASGVVGLVAIAGWLGAWVFSGRAWPAYVGLALAPGWVMAEIAGTPLGSLGRESAAALAGLLPPVAALALAYRARRSPDVDTTLRPFHLLGGLMVGTVSLFGVVMLTSGRVPETPNVVVAMVGVAGAAAWCLAGQVFGRADGLCVSDRRSLAVSLCAFGAAALERTAGRLHPDDDVASWAFSGARSVVLVGWVLLLAAAAHSIVRARRAYNARQHDLRVARDAIADGLADQRRRIEERRHDIRSLVSGIQGASTTLARYRAFLDAAEQRDLEAALLSEIDRLQHSINADAGRRERFALRDAVGPVITAERARGTLINAELPEVEVLGRADATAAVVQNLVTNTRRHAPGAAVSVTARARDGELVLVVSDDGPGLPPAVRDRVAALFDAGDAQARQSLIPRQPSSDGHGLGLAICARLAAEQGGRLQLGPAGVGTTIELTLRLAAGQLLGDPR